MSLYLGIDTSNYTTSAALVREGRVLQNCKIPVPVAAGERGVRQSDAVFAHVKNLPSLMEGLHIDEPVAAIGCSAYPRDAEGSYMPCFLTGSTVARSAASLLCVPCYAFSHQAGHVAAAVYSSGRREVLGDRFVAFHVSGGTTELLLAERKEGAPGYRITLLGGSADLTAGQAIDRTGVRLGLPFPCGPSLETLAAAYPFPRTRPSTEGLTCHLSGLENQTKKMIEEGEAPGRVAAYLLAYIKDTLALLAEGARERYPGIPLLFAGGVMSCRRIREEFEERFGGAFAEPAYSADNAAGIALLCEEKHRYEIS